MSSSSNARMVMTVETPAVSILPAASAVSANPVLPATVATAPALPAPPPKRLAASGTRYAPKLRGRDVRSVKPRRFKTPGCDAPRCCQRAMWGVGLLIPIPLPEAPAPEAKLGETSILQHADDAHFAPSGLVAVDGSPLTLPPPPAPIVPKAIPAVPTDALGFACEEHRDAIVDRTAPWKHAKWHRIMRECQKGFGFLPDPHTVTVRHVKLFAEVPVTSVAPAPAPIETPVEPAPTPAAPE